MTLHSIGRRRFIQGAAALGLGTALGLPRAHAAQATLTGTSFDLTIGEMPVNITGTPARATVVNGMMPGPILRWREGDTVTVRVTNRLKEETSIHWHGMLVPTGMDGVPGLSFNGIAPGQSFTYRFPVRQAGTYWYHSHSGFQEQTGLYGALIVEPRAGYAQAFDREHVVLLSDWSDEDPDSIVDNLKMQSDYYNRGQRTVGDFLHDAGRDGLGATVADRLHWGEMRMSPTDIADVTGETYTYLMNGQSPAANWSALFKPGERVRLRIINGSSMTFFDVRIPGLKLTVVQADGNEVEPVAVDELRLGVAETYDVIVEPGDAAYTIFAQAADRSGFARGTLSSREGMTAPAPALDPRPVRSMADMGMGAHGGMDHGSMNHGSMAMEAPKPDAMPTMAHHHTPGMDMSGMGHGAMNHGSMNHSMPAAPEPAAPPVPLDTSVSVDNVAMSPANRLNEAGTGLDGNGRRVLLYTDLKALKPGADTRPPSRTIELHLTGNMNRYIWGFDGKKFSEAPPIRLAFGERVRFVLTNDTMMEHPIHLHGLWSELENGQGDRAPYKHTIIVKPGERLSYLVTAAEKGLWAFHCHLLYHMEMGMFRTVVVA